MMRLSVLPLVLVMMLMAGLIRAAEDPGTTVPAPEGGRPWHDEKTGLAFPSSLGDVPLEDILVAQGRRLGEAAPLRGHRTRGSQGGHLHPVTCPAAVETGKERELAANEELGEVMKGLKEMETKGRYKDVKWDQGSMQPFMLADQSKTAFISVPARYEVVDDEGRASTTTPVTSLAGVLVFHDQFVKLRYTLPADAGREALAQRAEFVAQMLRCVVDATLRGTMQKRIADYLHDPLSDAGRKAASEVVTFSDKSPLVNVVIGDGLTTFAKACKPQGVGIDDDVMRAFIVGAASSALRDETAEAVVHTGIDQVKDFCEKMAKANAHFWHPPLGPFEAAVLKENERLISPP